MKVGITEIRIVLPASRLFGMQYVGSELRSAPGSNTALCMNFWLKTNVIPHPPYSPDLVLCDFFLFQILKMATKGQIFDDITMIEAKSWDAPAQFQTMHIIICCKRWHDHWACCIKSQNDYFQCNNID
jgi:hypothetical protein